MGKQVMNQNQSRADQNTGDALLEFPVRTAMYETSRVSSAISLFNKETKFHHLPTAALLSGLGDGLQIIG